MSEADLEADGDSVELRSRQEVLTMLNDVLDEAHRKVESGRIYDAENERVRQGWVRAFAYAANQYRQLKRDEELEEMNERMARLEARTGVAPSAGAGSEGDYAAAVEAAGGDDDA